MPPPPAKHSRCLTDASSSSSNSNAEVSDVFQKHLLPLIDALGNVPSISDQLATAITNLHHMLEVKLDRIAVALENHNYHVCSTAPTPNLNSQNVHSPTVVVEQLRDLKNARYNSVDKKLMNEAKRTIYQEGLQHDPQLVPHKLHEKILQNDDEKIKAIKIKQTVQNVEMEIEKLQIHQVIHENKITKIDEKAKELLNNIVNSATKDTLARNWTTITERNETGLTKKWIERTTFLRSERHITELGRHVIGIHQQKIDLSVSNNVNRQNKNNGNKHDVEMSYSDAVKQPGLTTFHPRRAPNFQDRNNALRQNHNSFYFNNAARQNVNSRIEHDVEMCYGNTLKQPKASTIRTRTTSRFQDQKNGSRIPRPPRPRAAHRRS